MTEKDKHSPGELAAEIMSADRPSDPRLDDPPPNAAMGPFALALYPLLRRHQRWLLPVIVLAIVGLFVLEVVA